MRNWQAIAWKPHREYETGSWQISEACRFVPQSRYVVKQLDAKSSKKFDPLRVASAGE
jgi:hypothetical protein